MKTVLILALLAIAMLQPVLAFEVNGMRYSMSKEEAIAVLKSRHGKVVSPFGGAKLVIAGNEAATFCKGSLIIYQLNIDGQLASFVRLVKTETRTKGSGTFDLESYEEDGGSGASLSFTWEHENYQKVISLSGNDQVSQVYIRYFGPNACSQ